MTMNWDLTRCAEKIEKLKLEFDELREDVIEDIKSLRDLMKMKSLQEKVERLEEFNKAQEEINQQMLGSYHVHLGRIEVLENKADNLEFGVRQNCKTIEKEIETLEEVTKSNRRLFNSLFTKDRQPPKPQEDKGEFNRLDHISSGDGGRNWECDVCGQKVPHIVTERLKAQDKGEIVRRAREIVYCHEQSVVFTYDLTPEEFFKLAKAVDIAEELVNSLRKGE